MIFKDSRYQAICDNSKNERIGQRPITTAKGLLEHVVKHGERLDQIAGYYYDNPKYWWMILDANPDIRSACDFCLSDYSGQTILIPGFIPEIAQEKKK